MAYQYRQHQSSKRSEPQTTGLVQGTPPQVQNNSDRSDGAVSEQDTPHESVFHANMATVPLRPKIAKGTSPDKKETQDNQTGLPDSLKAGIERMSGFDMSDVRVHYDSPKPSKLNAYAYTHRTDIHVGPGQEKYLPHEAWHVVQQKRRRVTPTMQMHGIPINDDEGLEREAEAMGSRLGTCDQSDRGHIDYGNKTASLQNPRVTSVVTQCGKKKKRRRLLTRIIRPDQLRRPNIGIRSVRSSTRSLARNLLPLRALGKGVSLGSRIYSYMRKYGGAGIQGFHREAEQRTRAEVVRGILQKMNDDPKRTTRSSRGKKFVIVVTHQDLLGRGRVYDLRRSKTRRLVLSDNRAKFHNMYEHHKTEGVVAVDGDVSVDEMLAMRAFRGVPSEEELDEIIDELLDEAERRLMELLGNDDECGEDEKPQRKDDTDDDEESMGDGLGLPQLVNEVR